VYRVSVVIFRVRTRGHIMLAGLRVRDSGFGVHPRCRVLAFRVTSLDSGYRAHIYKVIQLKVQGEGLERLGFGDQGLGFEVLGFEVLGFEV